MKVDHYRGEKRIDLFDVFMVVMVFGCIGFFIWGTYQLFVWKPVFQEPRYGCEQVYKYPEVWRCGQYGSGSDNQHILYTDSWIAKGEFTARKER